MSFERVPARPYLYMPIAIALFTVPLFLVLAISVSAADKIKLPCEVLEISGAPHTRSDTFKKVHFMVIHHANAADREKLSTWLKANSGTDVWFTVLHRKYQGILYRMAHCFGRGLLLYTDRIDVKARDIIEVTLPESPSQ